MNNNAVLQHSKVVFLNQPLDQFLNKDDYEYYQTLKKTLSSHICRNCRNRRVESFNEILLAIRYFVDHSNEDAWKRSLVCGVCWYKNYICVNIKQMSEFLEKCKSSINGSLQRLCLIVLQNKQQSFRILSEANPYLKNHKDLRKMWSVRQLIISNQINIPPPISCHNSQKQSIIFPSKKHKKQLDIQSISKEVTQKIELKQQINEKKEINLNPIKIDTIANSNIKSITDLFGEIDFSEGVFD